MNTPDLALRKIGIPADAVRRIVASRPDLVSGIRPAEPTEPDAYLEWAIGQGFVVITEGGANRWTDEAAHATYRLMCRRQNAHSNVRRPMGRPMRRRMATATLKPV